MGKGTDLTQEIVQGAIALLALGGGMAMAIIGLVEGHQGTVVPDWMSLLIGAIIAFYFGQRGTLSGVREVTNGPLHAVIDATANAQNAANTATAAANAPQEKVA